MKTLFAGAIVLTVFANGRADEPSAAEKLKLAAQMAQTKSNLKQLGIAFHNYYSAYGKFPSNIVDQNGKLLLSWRVQLLPYLEQENLFKEFKRDESWDSEHNKKLLARMPKMYAPVRGKAGKNETYYRGFTGPGTMFEKGKKLTFRDIGDGSSNTLLFVEAEKPVPWTKPDDLPFNWDKNVVPKVGGAMFEDGFHCCLGDGSVHFIKKTIANDTLRKLIHINDGHAVNIP